MPVDHRRLPVPEVSKSPECFVTKCSTKSTFKQRKDGRQVRSIRPLHVQCGSISQAKGSAYLELGNTKVICAIYGPREVTKKEEVSMFGQIQCEFRYATFSGYRRKTHEPDDVQKDLSIIIQDALQPSVMLDKFPKARMDVFVTVLEDDGCCLAAAIMCCSAALVSAGIELYDIVLASSVRRCEELMLVDPVKEEEYPHPLTSEPSLDDGQITVSYMPSLDQVSSVLQLGCMPLEASTAMKELTIEACHSVYGVFSELLRKNI